MKNTHFILFSICMSLLACSKKKIEATQTPPKSETETTVVIKEKEKPAVTPTSTPQPTPETLIIPKGVDPNLIARISRTPCMGKCAVFTVELFNNGLVKYNGVAFVEKKGVFTAKVNADFIKKIQDKALSIKYLSLENKYPIAPVEIADLPSTITYIRSGNVGKQIYNNYEAPRELIEFESWLEREFDKLTWKAE